VSPLKSPFSARPSSLPEKVPQREPQSVDDDVIDTSSAAVDDDLGFVPEKKIGMPEAMQPPGISTFEQQEPFMRAGAGVAVPALAGAAAASLPVGLGVAAVGLGAAGVELFFDRLKNTRITDPSQKISDKKTFINAAISGALSGAGEGASRFFLGKLAEKAQSTGNKEILDLVDDFIKSKYGHALEEVKFAKGLGISLSPEEAFPFDPQAVQFSESALKEFPNLGAVQAEKIGKTRAALQTLATRLASGKNAKGIKDYASSIEGAYSEAISRYQNKINEIGADVDVMQDGQKILNSIKEEIVGYGGKFEGDVLTGEFEHLGEVKRIYSDLSNQLKVPSKPETFSRIVDEFGNPIKISDAEPAQIKQLSVGDIDRIRTRIQRAANFDKNPELGLTPEERAARSLYAKIRDVRDDLNMRIAQERGSPEFAQELRSFRDTYNSEIDGLRTIQSQLQNEPVDELKYLFKKNDPESAKAIMNVLPEKMRKAIKGDFLTRLIDPVYLREAGAIAPEQTLSSAYKELLKYDPGVLLQIYNQKELFEITRFLKLGETVEKVIAKTGKSPENLKVVKDLANTALNPSATGFVGRIINYLKPKSDLKKYMDARLWLAGKLKVENVSQDAIDLALKLTKSGKVSTSIAKRSLDIAKSGVRPVSATFMQAIGKPVASDIIGLDEQEQQ
jgi:hypothetical protein